jgi:L-fuculose-phosphate aldolase
MSQDWSIKPALPNLVFPWENYDPQTPEEVAEFFELPEIQVIKERMCDMGRRLWTREFVDGNGGNLSVRVSKDLLLCSPTLISKGFMKPEDICLVDMEGRQKAGIRPSTSEVKTHIAMMKSVGVNACIHAHPAHCNAFLFAGIVPPSGINPEADIFLGHIALAPYGTPGSPATAQAVSEAAKQSTVVFMENHGVITGARHIEEAYWFMENADAYCRMVLLAAGHKAPLNQVGEEGVRDFLAIRKSIGYSVPEGQPLYNMSTFAGYTLGKAGK